jgi:hypothetical protein
MPVAQNGDDSRSFSSCFVINEVTNIMYNGNSAKATYGIRLVYVTIAWRMRQIGVLTST